MSVYLMMLFGVFVLGMAFESQRKKEGAYVYNGNDGFGCNIIFFFISCIFVGVSGFRYRVGADFGSYYENYGYYVSDKLNIFKENEIGIRLIAKLAKIIHDTPQTYIFICSLVTIVLFLITIKKYSDKVLMSLFLFVFLGMFLGSFNGMRQYLACAVLFFGIRFVFENKPFKWCVCVLLAFFCHTAAMFMLPMYWLVRMKNRKKFIFVLIIVAVFAFTSYDRIFDMIDTLKGNTDVSVSDKLYAQNSVNIFRVVVAWMPVFLCYFPTKIKKGISEKDTILMNYVYVAAVFQTVSMNSTYLARFCTFTTSTNILTIPTLLKYQTSNNKKVLTILIYVGYFLYWLAEATGPFVANYQWCF